MAFKTSWALSKHLLADYLDSQVEQNGGNEIKKMSQVLLEVYLLLLVILQEVLLLRLQEWVE